MKKVIAKLGLTTVMTGLILLCGLVFGAQNAQAQTITKTADAWATPSEALGLLQQQIETFDNLLNQGAGAEIKVRMGLYREVVDMINNGQAVPKAVELSYQNASRVNDYSNVPAAPFTTNQWSTVYTELSDLLKIH